MEFKHSPAPWNNRVKYLDYRIVLDANNNKITLLSHDCREADMQLITAAPELLEALIEMQRNGRKQGWDDKYESSMERARLAIAKALGQQ